MALEEAFGISVDESGAEAIATVQDAADLIERTLCDKEDKAPAAQKCCSNFILEIDYYAKIFLFSNPWVAS